MAVDGSDHAFDAVRIASRLAAALSAKLTLMTAYHAPSDALGEPNYSRALGEALTEAQRVLDERAERGAQRRERRDPQVEWLAGAAGRDHRARRRAPATTTSSSWAPTGEAGSAPRCSARSRARWRPTRAAR